MCLREPTAEEGLPGPVLYGNPDLEADVETIHSQMPLTSYHNNKPKALWLHGEPLSSVGNGVSMKAIVDMASRVDCFIAISSEVQRRIARFYGRESVVIYPPVDTARFAPAGRPDEFFLVLGRLIPYKRADLAVKAFNELGLPLVIAGDGRDRTRLEAMAKPNVKFLGRVSDAEAADLMARCRAFIFPGLEDFGIAPVQAMAAGRPVIAFAGGGALDTVSEGQTGLLFREQTSESLVAAVQNFDESHFDPAAIRKHAETFDKNVFEKKLLSFVEEKREISNSKFQIPISNPTGALRSL